MPNIQVQLRRGTTTQHSTFTGAEGEVTVDTDKDTIVVHDNATAGGHELLKGVNSNLAVAATEVVVNDSGADVDFRVEGDGNANLINANGQNDIVGIGMVPDATDTFAGGTTYKAQIKDGAKIENDTGTAKLKLVSNKTGGGVASITLKSTTAPTTDEGNYSIFIGQALGRYNITNENTSKTLVMDKTGSWLPADDFDASSNPSQNLGAASARWSTVFANTGTINTSDRNEKEQIQDLSEAELRVAKTIKGLVKKFKFQGGKRTHVGVIAQDVEAAFSGEGLNASDYGMFCSDTFENEQGVTITRLGIRYEELLAFVIAAL